MSRQYKRFCSLIVSGGDGEGLDLSELRIEFKVRQWDIQTPNSADIRIWNLKPETSKRVEKEFTRVTLQAGYEGADAGIIFDGTIVQIRRGRANATDTFLDIMAADGDAAYNFAVVNASLAAGSKPEDRLKAITAAMEKYEVTQGATPEDGLGDAALPRGKVMFGMAQDHMRDLAASTLTTWSIQNGKVNVVKKDGYLPDEAVVLNSQTGLIGLPEQTQDGINARCLLNPKLKVSGRVQINNASIQRAAMSLQYTAINYFPSVAEDGFYRIVVIDHEGDTRGDAWYSDIVCVAIDETVSLGLGQRGYS